MDCTKVTAFASALSTMSVAVHVYKNRTESYPDLLSNAISRDRSRWRSVHGH
jgi:hypothetical protein